MNGFPRGQTAIVGSATFGVGETPGMQPIDLAARASIDALDQSHIPLRDVDALFLCLPDDMLSGLTFAEYLGLRPKITENNRVGGAAFQTFVYWAAMALAAGEIDCALIAYGSNQRSQAGKLVTPAQQIISESVYKPLMPISSYALSASRHMHEFGTTRAQLAEVAVSARAWANLNPEAFAHGPLTVEDCLAARMVSSPLGLRDCCLVTDGAAAIVMTRADRARDLTEKPAYVLGAAAATWHRNISQMPDLTTTCAVESGARAYAQAKLGPQDIDVVQLYDAFTINTLMFLEDLGFCPKGEGGRFVEDGRIAPDGELPVNTNGGGLSYGHPGMYGLFTLAESVAQISGTAGARQIPDVEVALAHGNGGTFSSEATVILGGEATV